MAYTRITRSLDKRLLLEYQTLTLSYFLDNQLPHGLILDRQANQGPLRQDGLCSTSATGMGLLAIALASTPEYGLLSRYDARRRISRGIEAAFRLEHVRGIMPHFTRSDGITPVGSDKLATIDSAWLVAGALLAAEIPGMESLRPRALELYNRVDWRYWTVAKRIEDLRNQPGDMNDNLVRHARGHWLLHGMRDDGTFLPSHWDLLNAETAFMYLLGCGAHRRKRLGMGIWNDLIAEREHVPADTTNGALGLFVSQYSLELVDFSRIPLPGNVRLQAECRQGVRANYRACRNESVRFKTYRRFWGMSAGDGPPAEDPQLAAQHSDDAFKHPDEYRPYGPVEPPAIDGTAHVMATVASVRVEPHLVLQNMRATRGFKRMLGRYGYSNVNLDRNWFSRDVVGIDVGAACMGIDNALHGNRLPRLFARSAPVARAISRFRRK